MIWPILVGGVIAGAAVFGSKSKIPTSRAVIIGPRSGREWKVEFLRDLGIMVVGNSTKVYFQTSKDGWKPIKVTGKSRPEAILIIKDFRQ